MIKKCRKCKEEKEIKDFPFFSTSAAGRKNTCKKCSKELAKLRKKLKKQNPPPEKGKCPICKCITTNWVLDHCHFDSSFRGYICNDCNLGLGKFNDDKAILKNALKYLENFSIKNH